MKVLKLFSDKLFQMTIAEIADLLVPIESKFEGGKGNERRTGKRFSKKLFRFCDLKPQAKFWKARFLKLLSELTRFPP